MSNYQSVQNLDKFLTISNSIKKYQLNHYYIKTFLFIAKFIFKLFSLSLGRKKWIKIKINNIVPATFFLDLTNDDPNDN